jgi:hypothetical protein
VGQQRLEQYEHEKSMFVRALIEQIAQAWIGARVADSSEPSKPCRHSVIITASHMRPRHRTVTSAQPPTVAITPSPADHRPHISDKAPIRDPVRWEILVIELCQLAQIL